MWLSKGTQGWRERTLWRNVFVPWDTEDSHARTVIQVIEGQVVASTLVCVKRATALDIQMTVTLPLGLASIADTTQQVTGVKDVPLDFMVTPHDAPPGTVSPAPAPSLLPQISSARRVDLTQTDRSRAQRALLDTEEDDVNNVPLATMEIPRSRVTLVEMEVVVIPTQLLIQ